MTRTIISLGGNCSVAYQLSRYGLRSESYPFDWCNMSINSLIRVLEEDFIGYEDIEIKKKSERHIKFGTEEATYIVRNRYNITMAHELVREEEMEEIREKLRRRVERLRRIRKPKFVRLETKNMTEEDVRKYEILLKILKEKYEDYEMVIISNREIEDERVRWYKLERFSEDWKYDGIEWQKIFI